LARARNARLSFAFVYPDRNGKNVVREVGVLSNFRTSADQHKTLGQLKFETGSLFPYSLFVVSVCIDSVVVAGDFLDVSITTVRAGEREITRNTRGKDSMETNESSSSSSSSSKDSNSKDDSMTD
jgi:hypothetical protein